MFAKETSTPTLDRRQSLQGVPVLNPGVTWKERTDGSLVVSIKVGRSPGVLGLFQPKMSEKRIELDVLGSFVLMQIDGEKTALQITEAFVARFKVHRREAELCIVSFLKSLLKRCIISIAIR
jgi:hypothetical protein